MKLFNLYHKLSILLTGLMLFIVSFVNATTYYSRLDGNWTNRNTWSLTSGGPRVGAGVYPVAGDNVYIENNHTVTVDANSACATMNIASGSAVDVGSAVTLTISGTTSVTGTLLSDLNTYDILNANFLVLTESAAKIFSEENIETVEA